ncbi:hypothetical protein SLA2020_016920 [Shorea laevis]
MEVVADSFDMFPEASDLGGRVEAGLMENRPQKKLTSDPIEISTGNNLGLQLKPNLKTPRQACDGEKEEGKENWASNMKDNNKSMENQSRIEHRSGTQNMKQKQRKAKTMDSLGSNREFWADLRSEEGSEKGWMAASNRVRKKKKKKRVKACKAVYQKASLQLLRVQRKKNRAR